MKIKNLKIGTQLMLGYAAMLVFVLVLGVVSYQQADKISLQTETMYNHTLKVRNAIGDLEADILSMRLGTRDLMLAKTNQEKQDAVQMMELAAADAHLQFGILKEHYLGPAAHIDEAFSAFVSWKTAREENTRLALSGEIEKIKESVLSTGKVGAFREQLLDKVKTIDDFAENESHALYAASNELKAALNEQLILLVAVILLLSILINYILLRNITDRKLAEKELKESQQLFQGLFNASPDAIVLLDPHHPDKSWPILDCNIATCQMNGYSREELIGQSIDLLNVTKGTDQERIRYFNFLKQQGITHFESSHRHKDGHVFPVEISSSVVVIGGHEMILGIDRDITERKKAEAELQNSYDLMNKLAAQVPGVVYKYLLRPDGSSAFPYSSPGMNDIYEVSPEEVREDASPVFTRIHPDDYNAVVESITESASNNTLYHSEFRVILPRQGLRWRLCDAKPERLEDGSTLWHGIITDITDRKQAELALKESEDRYKSFISQVTEGVYRFECDEPMDVNLPLEEQVDYLYDHFFMAECNDAMLKMYKISDRNEIVGKSHLDFHGGRDNPVNRELLRDFIRNGYSIENGITEEFDVNGQLKYISNNSVGITEHGYLIRTWGTETDITEKIRTDHMQQVLYAISNAALSSIDLTELIGFISAQLGKLLDSSNFYIAFYDEDTGMLSTHYEKDEKDSINSWPAEKSMTGYVIRYQKSLLATEADVKRLCEAGETELVGTASKIWLGVPLSVNNKVIGAIVVQSYDNPNAYTEKDQLMLEFISHQVSISIERKMAEEELKHALIRAQESDRLKSAFLANMSHEIRTPLNSIVGFSDLLLDPDFDPDQHAEFAGMISASGNSLLAIINDLMDISKIEAGQVQLQKSTFSVHKLIADIQKEYSFKAGEKGIELRLDSSNPRKELFIQSDENRLKQILINFVGNAIKFTERGFIEIGLITSDHTLQIQVKDSGIGIPKEFHHKIFERFTQVEASNKRKYGGNGLGLAISKSLAELLGGEIGLQSEQGKGSLFYITLPL